MDSHSLSERVAVAAGAMRAKRAELIAQPLQQVWVQLARSAVAAVDAWDARQKSESEQP